MGLRQPLLVYFKHKFYLKTVNFREILTRIVRVEGDHADHLTTYDPIMFLIFFYILKSSMLLPCQDLPPSDLEELGSLFRRGRWDHRWRRGGRPTREIRSDFERSFPAIFRTCDQCCKLSYLAFSLVWGSKSESCSYFDKKYINKSLTFPLWAETKLKVSHCLVSCILCSKFLTYEK